MTEILTALGGCFLGAIASLFGFQMLPSDFQIAPNMFTLTLLLTLCGGVIGHLVGEYIEDKHWRG